MSKRKGLSTNEIAKIAVLSAIAFVLMYLDFPLPFLPSFYSLDFSEVAVLIGGFALGPGAALIIEAIKIVLNILFEGSKTAYVGEIANFIIGVSLCVPAAAIYRKQKNKKNALRGMIVGSLCMIAVGAIMNYAVLLPAYSYFYHLPMDTLIEMGSVLIPLIKDKLTFVLLATVPFNLIKAVATGILTMLLYKRVSVLLHRGQ